MYKIYEARDGADLRMKRMKALAKFLDGRPDGATLADLKKFSVLHFGLVLKTLDQFLRDMQFAGVIQVKCLNFFITQAGKRWIEE